MNKWQTVLSPAWSLYLVGLQTSLHAYITNNYYIFLYMNFETIIDYSIPDWCLQCGTSRSYCT